MDRLGENLTDCCWDSPPFTGGNFAPGWCRWFVLSENGAGEGMVEHNQNPWASQMIVWGRKAVYYEALDFQDTFGELGMRGTPQKKKK